MGDTFLKREDIEEIAKAFSLEVVPIVLTGTIREAVDYVKTKPRSTIALEEKESEGLVGTPLARLTDSRGNRIIVKVKVCDF